MGEEEEGPSFSGDLREEFGDDLDDDDDLAGQDRGASRAAAWSRVGSSGGGRGGDLGDEMQLGLDDEDLSGSDLTISGDGFQ